MDYKHVEKDDYSGKKVKVLEGTFEPGTPDTKGIGDSDDWRKKFQDPDNNDLMKSYLKTGERYWYSDDWYGSDSRK